MSRKLQKEKTFAFLETIAEMNQNKKIRMYIYEDRGVIAYLHHKDKNVESYIDIRNLACKYPHIKILCKDPLGYYLKIEIRGIAEVFGNDPFSDLEIVRQIRGTLYG